MSDDSVDQILFQEEEILPSSGFAARVMDAVYRQASTPSPIPFPWKRAFPGLATAALTLLSVLLGFADLVWAASSVRHSATGAPVLVLAFHSKLMAQAGWVVLVSFVTLGAVKLSMRLTVA
jgi:hypothetical protein